MENVILECEKRETQDFPKILYVLNLKNESELLKRFDGIKDSTDISVDDNRVWEIIHSFWHQVVFYHPQFLKDGKLEIVEDLLFNIQLILNKQIFRMIGQVQSYSVNIGDGVGYYSDRFGRIHREFCLTEPPDHYETRFYHHLLLKSQDKERTLITTKREGINDQNYCHVISYAEPRNKYRKCYDTPRGREFMGATFREYDNYEKIFRSDFKKGLLIEIIESFKNK